VLLQNSKWPHDGDHAKSIPREVSVLGSQTGYSSTSAQHCGKFNGAAPKQKTFVEALDRMCNVKTLFVRLVLLLTIVVIANSAPAMPVYDSGMVVFVPGGIQFGRISRNGIPSDWSVPKPLPGVTGAPTT
jgi:hypothetical protein